MILSALLVVSIVAVVAFLLAAILFNLILRLERPWVAAGLFGGFAWVGCLLGAAGGALILPVLSDARPINLPLTALPVALALGAAATWMFLVHEKSKRSGVAA